MMAPLHIMHNIKFEIKKAFTTYKVHYHFPIKNVVYRLCQTNKDKNIITWPHSREQTSREPMSLQFVKHLEPKCQP